MTISEGIRLSQLSFLLIRTRVQFWVMKYSTKVFSFSNTKLKIRLHSQKKCL